LSPGKDTDWIMMETTRLEAFSDGVFAIAITLLVVAIALPAPGGSLRLELIRLWPSYLAYAISFFVIGAIWINHHGMFQHIVRTDNSFLVLNILQLMAIAFIPFPTAVLARAISTGSDERIATAFYGLTLFAVGIFVNLMWRYAARDRRLLDEALPDPAIRRIGRLLLVGPVVYAVATLAGFVMPWVALAIFIGINIFFLWPRQVSGGAPRSDS
jgi:uncharacterized membrane protein